MDIESKTYFLSGIIVIYTCVFLCLKFRANQPLCPHSLSTHSFCVIKIVNLFLLFEDNNELSFMWQLFMTGNAALVGSTTAQGIGAIASEVKRLHGRKRRISVTARALIQSVSLTSMNSNSSTVSQHWQIKHCQSKESQGTSPPPNFCKSIFLFTHRQCIFF